MTRCSNTSRTRCCSSFSTTSSRSSRPRRRFRRCSPPPRARRCSSPAASRCTWSPSSATRSSRCPTTTLKCSSSNALVRLLPDSARRRPSSRSADASTGCRSRSSWRPPASRCSIRTTSSHGWTSGFPVLTSRSRDAPARQRTLRAAIEWSYELLELTEQTVFRCLAVFRGSFSLGAAEAICGADLDVLESLLEKNLVRRWGSGRLGMLDTIGEYALERLDESPEAGAIHQRHGEFFLGLAESANLNAAKLDARKPMRQDIANADHDNFRGAIAWAISSGSVGLGLKLASALDWFWMTNDPAEG